jgi:hypothetical protein
MARAKPPGDAAPARRAPRTKPASKSRKAAPQVDLDLHELGARVLSVFGPFGSRVLLEMPTDVAAAMFPEPLSQSSRTGLIEAVERDVAQLAKRDRAIAGSALAAAAVALAYEIENPYNSATSKSMCAGQLRDTLDRLRELAPAEEETDGLDDLSARRAARIAGASRT